MLTLRGASVLTKAEQVQGSISITRLVAEKRCSSKSGHIIHCLVQSGECIPRAAEGQKHLLLNRPNPGGCPASLPGVSGSEVSGHLH